MRIKSYNLLFAVLAFLLFGCDGAGDQLGGESTGQGGSMTRFAISGNYMYVVDHEAIKVFRIGQGEFEQVDEVSVSPGLETIFAKGEFLYLGAVDAMYIWSISNPETPSFLFRYQHITSCDPVVVQGTRAYVTLRGGTFCNQGTNALEIIDISDPLQPVLVANYPMQSPHGLGVDGNLLFLCEGENGFKVFDITDEHAIEEVAHLTEFFAYDVIALNGIATVTGEDGIFQFSYDAGGEPEMLSTIPVVRQ